MAFSRTLRKLITPNLITKSINPFFLASSNSRLLIAPNLITKPIIPFFPASSRFLNTTGCDNHKRVIEVDIDPPKSIERVDYPQSISSKLCRTAGYFLRDLNPFTSGVRIMSIILNLMELGISPYYRSYWKVRQNDEALVIMHPNISEDDETIAATYLWVYVEQNSKIDGSKNVKAISAENVDTDTSLVKVEPKRINQPATLIIDRKVDDHEDEHYGRYKVKIDLQSNLYDTSAVKIERNNDFTKIIVPKLKPKGIDTVNIDGVVRIDR